MSRCIRLHPANPRVFELHGKPLVLVTATEHYGAVMNRPMHYDRYLMDCQTRGINYTRLFVLFRELQSAVNPYSTCKPDSVDYIAPFERSGGQRANDGMPKFDLDRPNSEFLQRLHGFLSLAETLRIVVEVTLLSNTYGDDVWALNPFHPNNNINGMPQIAWYEYMTLRHPELVRRQMEHVRRIVRETRRYSNVIYELCNEPGALFPALDSPSQEEVNAWQREIARVIREAEGGQEPHLISGQEAFTYAPYEQPTDGSYDVMPLDVVNIHPLPGMRLAGHVIHMGDFMGKQLRLQAVRDFCLLACRYQRPLVLDEDNSATMYREPGGWTIHRKRAWTAVCCGAHYNCIDFSVAPWVECGTPTSQAGLRTPFGALCRWINSIDLISARPLTDTVKQAPEHVLPLAFGDAERELLVYLPDAREIDEGEGAPICGELTMNLAEGDWMLSSIDPMTGCESPAIVVAGGPGTVVQIPAFVHDLALHLIRIDGN